MELGLFLIHVVLGVLLVGHGAQKLFGVFGGYGLDGTAGFMESLGLRPGKPLAAAAGASEVAGGALLALGLATPLAALLIVSVMVVAARTAHRGKGPWITDEGWEYTLVNATVAVGLAINGVGQWSLDNAIGWDVSGLGWGIGAAALGIIGGLATIAVARRTPAPAGGTEASAV